MSEFPEIQPFGPRPASHNEEPPSEPRADTPAQPVTPPATYAQQSHTNLTAAILTAVGLGFALGYLLSRYQQLIIRQGRRDELLNYAQAGIREQGPQIAEPIRQGLESTGSTVEQAFKNVRAGHPFDSWNLFHRTKPRKFLGFLG
jgi:uncharacterized protein HemX